MYVTPCVGICKIKDNVCIGCKRTVEQITAWITMTDEERILIMKDLGYMRRRVRKLPK